MACDEGRHDASGAMLGLEGAVGIEDKGHHVLGEFFVTIQARFVAEVFDDEEVNVPVLGMAEDDRLWVIVFAEKLLQVFAHRGEVFDGNGDVLQQGCLARLPCAGDLGIKATAQGPDWATHNGVVGERGLIDQIQFGGDGVASCDSLIS